MGIELEGLLQPQLGARQVAGLPPQPAVLRIGGGQLRLAGQPVLDHLHRFLPAAAANHQGRQRMPARGMVRRPLQALEIVLLSPIAVALPVVALAEVIKQARISRGDGEGCLKALACPVVVAAVEESDAILVVLPGAVFGRGRAAGQANRQSQSADRPAHGESPPAWTIATARQKGRETAPTDTDRACLSSAEPPSSLCRPLRNGFFSKETYPASRGIIGKLARSLEATWRAETLCDSRQC